jgi:hypothetical protein
MCRFSARAFLQLPFALSRDKDFEVKSYDFSELGIATSVVGSVTQSSPWLALVSEPVWFHLKAQPKGEHLAATALRHQFASSVFRLAYASEG